MRHQSSTRWENHLYLEHGFLGHNDLGAVQLARDTLLREVHDLEVSVKLQEPGILGVDCGKLVILKGDAIQQLGGVDKRDPIELRVGGVLIPRPPPVLVVHADELEATCLENKRVSERLLQRGITKNKKGT